MDMAPPDLFATKGLEYLVVLGYLAALVVLLRFLSEGKPVQTVAQRIGGWFILPKNSCFHQGHSWAIPEDEKVMKVGMDDFAHRLLGRLDAVRLPGLGARLSQGERGWELRVGSTSLEMLSPVDGDVVGVNYEVVDSPEVLCSDPYGQGWLLRVRVPDQKRNRKNLLCGTLAQAWLEEELRTMRVALGLVLPELGAPAGCDGFARVVAPDDWPEVAEDLFLSREAPRTGVPPARRVVGWFSLPDGYCFHQGHSWAMPQEGNIVTVGMDEFVGWLLGRPSGLELPEVGHYLWQGERGWAIEIGSRSMDLLSPVEGEVVAVNEAVLTSPETFCLDPYGHGWLLKVRVPNQRRNQKNLLCGGLARAWMEQKLRDLRGRTLPASRDEMALPDGGTTAGCSGFVRALAPENWDEVASELLLSED